MLSVTGTAAIINLLFTSGEIGLLNTALAKPQKEILPTQQELDKDTFKGSKSNLPKESGISGTPASASGSAKILHEHDSPTLKKDPLQTHVPGSGKQVQPDCVICHIPYSPKSMPYNVHMKKCAVCK